MPAAAMMLANGTLESSSTFQKLHVGESLELDEECGVFGVLLSEDRRTCEANSDGSKCGRLILGSIVVGNTSVRQRHCNELRQILHAQFPTLSGNFVFLSRDGWPILRHQESSVRACQVINKRNAIEIQRNFGNDKCRLAVLTQSKQILGFIFCDLNATLQQVREAISDQLKEIRCLQGDYHFADRHEWPVTKAQENQILLSDVLANDCICVNIVQSDVGSCVPSHRARLSEVSETATVTFSSPPGLHTDEPDHSSVQLRMEPTTRTKKNRNTIKNLIWSKSGDKHTRNSTSSNHDTGGNSDTTTEMVAKLGLVAKPILLSYVRAEAASHAINLKEELCKRGFSVYLDVHEIRTGNDWQDALNFAVSNCTVFVPLITPQYGMTQWTNREVKLADVLHKFIIPVNFLDRWPPECLAIQFASTQYVPWRPLSDAEHDYRFWDHQYIVQVATEICTRFKLMFNNKTMHVLRHTVKVKEPRHGSVNKVDSVYALDNNLCNITEEGAEDTKEKFVVISAHPKDFIFAEDAKRELTDAGFKVWSSTELLDDSGEGDVFSSGGIPLSTIPEGETYNPSPKLPLARLDTDDKRALCRLSSQISSIGAMTESLTPEKIERLTMFQKNVNKATVVVVLISQAYTESSTSLQQIFYCEHRKKIIMVKMDDKPVRSIYSMLMRNNTLMDVNDQQILANLLNSVKRCFKNQAVMSSKEENNEAKMQYLVNFVKKNLPEFRHCVYISGSTNLQSKRSEEICNAIGQALAKIKCVNVVTGGFYGAGDIVARAFENTRLLEVPNNYAEKPVVHILPTQDREDFSQKVRQNEDGSFEAPPYGRTIFLGDCVRERESAAARLFDICIVVEGGPGAAHEVEEFIWNDHFVIPIISSGGAAGGQFGVPLKILETPPSVSNTDWSVLSEKEASPDEVAEAVANIVKSLNQAVSEHAKREAAAKAPPTRKVRRRSRKSRKKRESLLHAVPEEADDNHKNNIALDSVDKQCEIQEDETMCAGPHRWQKFFKIFKPTRLIT